MEQSGASLVEVGTTNKTHYSDYEDAITEETRALLKVHTSNYRIVGFTESVGIAELTELAGRHDIPIIEDLGSGVLLDLSKYGITYEPTVQDSIRAGADVVCFSGDKLLGGPQAGIIVGKKKYIDRMKKNQLMRALRIDKFTATALESVLLDYLSEEQAISEIPVLRMITKSQEDVRKDARYLMRVLKEEGLPLELHLMACESQIGGGSLPLERIASAGVSIRPLEITTETMEERLRRLPVPMIPRVVNGELLLDVRTMDRNDFRRMAEEWNAYGICRKEEVADL
jgi:L-seryl-tRNA(Ser) seleniumtransferase